MTSSATPGLILNVGSLNQDFVYHVPHFVTPGETLAATDHQVFFGGKGFNQSVAIARAGGRLAHLGGVGRDGTALRDHLASLGADVDRLAVRDVPTGRASIQVTPDGENAIVLFGGVNQALQQADVEAAIRELRPAALLLQNETNAVAWALAAAAEAKIPVIYNPAPMTDAVAEMLERHPVDTLIVNAGEARQLANDDPARAARALAERFGIPRVVVTLGGDGCLAVADNEQLQLPAAPARQVTDTTGAGDTFVGYLAAALQMGLALEAALRRAGVAAALAVEQPGAAASIPDAAAVDARVAALG